MHEIYIVACNYAIQDIRVVINYVASLYDYINAQPTAAAILILL